MRVTLVSPCALGSGLPLDGMLAEWAGALGAIEPQGVGVRVVSLETKAVDRLTDDGRLKELLTRSRAYIAEKTTSGDFIGASWLKTRLDAAEPALLAAAAAKATLRDSAVLADPTRYRDAYRTVTTALEYVFQLEPRFEASRASVGQEIADFLTTDPWTPLAALESAELWDDVLFGEPELVAIRVPVDDALADAFRTAAGLRRRRPKLKIVLGGPPVAEAVVRGAGDARLIAVVDELLADDDPVRFAAVVAKLIGVATPDPLLPTRPAFERMESQEVLGSRPIYDVVLRLERDATCDEARIERLVSGLAAIPGAMVRIADADSRVDDLTALAAAVRRHGGRPVWTADTDVGRDLLRPDRAAELFAGGCRALVLDVGSASPRVRERIGGQVSTAELPRVFACLRDAGITPIAKFRIGHPGEDRSAVLETVKFLATQRAVLGHAAYDGVFGGLNERYAAPAVDWIPRPRTGHLVKEELRPLDAMLSGFDRRTWLREGRHLPLLVAGDLGEPPFAIPPVLEAFCTPYPKDFHAPPEAFSATGDQVLFDDDFGFRAMLEAAFEDIRAEWRAFPHATRIAYRDPGASDGYWAQIGLCGAGMRVPSLRRSAPNLAAALDRVPGLYTAAFSIVGPHTRITPHCGEDRTLLRCHLPIDIPEPSGLVVGGVRLPWTEGRTMVFDDTLAHAAWNDADREKVLLLIDFRPACRRAQGFVPSPEQEKRDRAHYVHLFPEWAAEVDGTT